MAIRLLYFECGFGRSTFLGIGNQASHAKEHFDGFNKSNFQKFLATTISSQLPCITEGHGTKETGHFFYALDLLLYVHSRNEKIFSIMEF